MVMMAKRRKTRSTAGVMDDDSQLFFHQLTALVVDAVSVREGYGTGQHRCLRVCATAGGRKAELLVRIVWGKGSHARWTLQGRSGQHFSMLTTFAGFSA
jgi:hypothetical protein